MQGIQIRRESEAAKVLAELIKTGLVQLLQSSRFCLVVLRGYGWEEKSVKNLTEQILQKKEGEEIKKKKPTTLQFMYSTL